MMGKPPQEKKNAKEHGCPFFYFFIFFTGIPLSRCIPALHGDNLCTKAKEISGPNVPEDLQKKKITSSMVIVIWPSGLDFILFLSFDSI